MADIWVTNGTPTMPGILNPLMAACDQGYVPGEVWILSNPGVADYVVDAADRFEVIIDAYGRDADVAVHDLEHETDFPGIIGFYRSTIEAAQERGDTVAVDVTPGRKFMSAIAFQAGSNSTPTTCSISTGRQVGIMDCTTPKSRGQRLI